MASKTEKKEFTKVGKYVYDPSAEPLGSGTFGTVFKGAELANKHNKVAIKIINRNTRKSFEALFKEYEKEIKNLKRIKGKNLLEYKHSYATTDGDLYIITKFYKDGNLSDYMDRAGGKLPLATALKILKLIAQTFCCLETLSMPGKKDAEVMMHRDIKPDNILMEGDEPILADFGLTKFIPKEDRMKLMEHTAQVGTPSYMSPQILGDERYSYKCDIWSMGVVTYEMIFGIDRRPWMGRSKFDLEKNIREKPLVFPEDIPTDAQDLLKRMLAIDENHRLDWEGVLYHSALQQISI